MSFAWTMISPFVATATKQKIKWVNGDAPKLGDTFKTMVAEDELEVGAGVVLHFAVFCSPLIYFSF